MPAQIRRMSAVPARSAEITVKSKTTTSADTTQRHPIVSYPQKVEALTRIPEVEEFDAMIVFVRTKNETETLAEKLRARGYSAMAINGDLGQAQRERTVGQRSGTLDILVATDVWRPWASMSTGSAMSNFDIPTDTESYVPASVAPGAPAAKGDRDLLRHPRERHPSARSKRRRGNL